MAGSIIPLLVEAGAVGVGLRGGSYLVPSYHNSLFRVEQPERSVH